MFGPPAKELLKSLPFAWTAGLLLMLGHFVSLPSRAAAPPNFTGGTFLGTYEVQDVYESDLTHDQFSKCKNLPFGALVAPHCGKTVWAIRGPHQIALIEVPNSQLKTSTRLDAFAMFGDPFCIAYCRWESSSSYGALRRTLFNTSKMIRGFKIPDDAITFNSLLDQELSDFDVYLFHKELEREKLNILLPGEPIEAAIYSMTTSLMASTQSRSSSTWRVLLPKDSYKQPGSDSPGQILLRETFRTVHFAIESRTHREYVLIKK